MGAKKKVRYPKCGHDGYSAWVDGTIRVEGDGSVDGLSDCRINDCMCPECLFETNEESDFYEDGVPFEIDVVAKLGGQE